MSASRNSLAAVARAAAFSILIASPAAAFAQDSTHCSSCTSTHAVDRSNEFERRSSGSIAFVQVRPLADLARNIGFGYGGMGTYVFRLDHNGILGLRADVGITGYGQESENVPLSSTIGGRIRVDVTTTNYMVPFSIGPQLSVPIGRAQTYVNAGFGGQAFYTQSEVNGDDDSFDFAHTTNQQDVTRTWVFGGGMLLPVYEGRPRVLVDLGAQYYTGGHAQYLRPGSIQDAPFQINPLESDTHMLLVRLGIHITL
jgi:hypothetical protein